MHMFGYKLHEAVKDFNTEEVCFVVSEENHDSNLCSSIGCIVGSIGHGVLAIDNERHVTEQLN